MGIDISATKVISLTEAHQRIARTSAAGPPRVVCAGRVSGARPIRVACIFPRIPDEGSGAGASALAWALKDLRGYSIAPASRRAMLRRAIEVGAKAFRPGDFDAILPLPSSGPVVERMCAVLERRLGCQVCRVLRKLTVGEAMWRAPRPSQVPETLRGCFIRQLQAMARSDISAPVRVKSISVRIRRFFPLIDVEPDLDLGRYRRVLLVDDILSTGSSFYLGCP